MKHLKLFFALFAMLALGVGNAWAAEVTINFGSGAGDVTINDFNISTTDSYGTTWSITTVASDKSFTQNGNYSQIGASKKPATSITLTGTIPQACTINSINAKWGGFSGTEGQIAITINGNSYASGKLNATSDVTVSAIDDVAVSAGDKIVISVTSISKGVKLYSLSYTYTESSGGGETETPVVTLDKIEATLNLEETLTLHATVENSEETIVWASDKESVATVSNGVVTAIGAGKANITATVEGVTATCVVTVKDPNAPAWTLVTNASTLKAGDKIVIAGTGDNSNYALSTEQKSNNRGAVAATKTDDKIEEVDNMQILTLETGTKTGTFAFNTGSGYLYAASSSSNHLKTQTTNNDNGSWTIAIADGVATVVAQGANTHNTMRYNYNNGSPLFAAYVSSSTTGALVAIYTQAKPAGTPDAPTLTASQEFETETFTVEISAVDGATIHYTLGGSDPTEASTTYSAPFTVNATTTVKAIAVKDGVASNVATATYTKVSVIEKTCAEAAALCTSSTESTDKYRVEGYVTAIETAYSAQYNNITVWMADTRNGGNVLQAFRATPTVDADKAVKVGDQIEVVGKLKLYNSVPEIVSGTYTITQLDPVYNVNITSEHGTVTATPMSGIEGTEVTLTVEAASGWVFDSWTVTYASSNTIEVTNNKFTMPASDVNVVANYTESVADDAVLILMANTQEHSRNTYKIGETVELPATIANDCVKMFVGWSADANCATTPEYAPGADFELTAEEHTLYAVYGTQTGGGEGVLTKMTSTDAFANGDKVVIVAYGTQLGMYQETSGTSYVKYWELAGNEPTVAELDDKTIWDVEADGENWKIGDATTGYLYNASSNNLAVSTTNASIWTITWKENGFVFKSDLGRYMACRTDLTTSNQNLYRMNGTTIGNNGVYEMDVYKYTSSAPIYSEFSTTCSAAPDAPVFSVGTGTYNAAQTVSITAEEGATIHYTLNGNDPTDKSDVYSSALTISETTTLKAIAVKDGLSSAITTATYTIKLPLTTIDQIFAKAKEVDGTATAVEITMGGWTVSGVNDKNVFVTDGTKGFIIYKSDGGHGFVAGDVLSGTVACKVQLFKGSAELTELTSTTSGLTVTPGGTVTPVTLDAAGITALTGVNTGSVIKINGTCTLENSKYYVAGVQLYNTLYEFQTLEPSAEYNVTGVYQLYTTTKEILPRQEADIEKIESLPTATISIADITMEVEETKTITATIYPAAAADAVVYSTTSSCISISGNTITGVTEGTATVTATIADADDKYYGAIKDFTVTVTPKSTKDKVVILAEYDGQWYAMMAQYVSGKTSHLAALPISYVGGKLYNIADADKTLIEWDRAVVDGKATFSNNSKYLTGKSDKTDLTLAATSCNWTISDDSYLIGARTFLYNAENNWFRNFGTSNAGDKNYSGMPVVTAPVYATGLIIGEGENTLTDGETKDVVISRSFTADALYTISLPFALDALQVEAIFGTGTTLYQFSGLEQADKELVMQFSNVTAIAAATPYLIKPAQNVDPGTLVEDVIIEIDPVNIEFTAGATTVTMKPILSATEEKTNGTTQYWLATDNYLYNNETQLLSLRALFEMTTKSGMPPRCRAEFSENEETALDYISTTDAPIKVIENGQLIIIRDGEMYNAMGVKL